MLPAPITFSATRNAVGGRLRLRALARRWSSADHWATRSRLSNGAVGALLLFSLLSLVLNAHTYLSSSGIATSGASTSDGSPNHLKSWRHPFGEQRVVGDAPAPRNATHGGVGRHGGPPPAQRIERLSGASALTHLVVVPGHAIWRGTRPELRMADAQWHLAPYQKGKDRVRTLFSHITRGAEITLKDPNALLVFSGGQTHASSSQTEAQSYLRLALLSNVFHDPEFDYDDDEEDSNVAHDPKPFPRATTEDFALDSFQNLAFSIARFHQFTGRYPAHITVVGYEMKRKRFEQLHRAALRWPADKFKYVGVGLDPMVEKDAWDGEVANALTPYTHDLYGCHPPLVTKRLARNPAARVHPYGQIVLPQKAAADQHHQHSEQAAVSRLLAYCPPEGDLTAVYGGSLPWDLRQGGHQT